MKRLYAVLIAVSLLATASLVWGQDVFDRVAAKQQKCTTQRDHTTKAPATLPADFQGFDPAPSVWSEDPEWQKGLDVALAVMGDLLESDRNGIMAPLLDYVQRHPKDFPRDACAPLREELFQKVWGQVVENDEQEKQESAELAAVRDVLRTTVNAYDDLSARYQSLQGRHNQLLTSYAGLIGRLQTPQAASPSPTYVYVESDRQASEPGPAETMLNALDWETLHPFNRTRIVGVPVSPFINPLLVPRQAGPSLYDQYMQNNLNHALGGDRVYPQLYWQNLLHPVKVK